MQFKKTTLSWLIFIIPALCFCPIRYACRRAPKRTGLSTRMDIKLKNDTTAGFYFTTKPYLRKTMVEGIERYFSRTVLMQSAGGNSGHSRFTGAMPAFRKAAFVYSRVDDIQHDMMH